MAKSARASVVKRNNQALRKTIFGPAVDARTERLSAKLQELIAKPKPESEKAMDVDNSNEEKETGVTQDVDVEMNGTTISRKPAKKAKSTRIEKKMMAKRKPRNKVVFPTSAAKQKRLAQSKKKSG